MSNSRSRVAVVNKESIYSQEMNGRNKKYVTRMKKTATVIASTVTIVTTVTVVGRFSSFDHIRAVLKR